LQGGRYSNMRFATVPVTQGSFSKKNE
jgi:hypothetical protein